MNQKTIIALLGILSIILLGTTVFFASINNPNNPDSTVHLITTTGANIPAVTTNEKRAKTDEAPWKTYSSSNLKISFKYPSDWHVYEEKEIGFGYRIYIQSSQIEDATNENEPSVLPDNFQKVWISNWEQETTEREENNLKNNKSDFSEIYGQVSISLIQVNGVEIRTYDYQTGQGPMLDAYWENRVGERYNATTMSEHGSTENQKEMIENLRRILATVKSTENAGEIQKNRNAGHEKDTEKALLDDMFQVYCNNTRIRNLYGMASGTKFYAKFIENWSDVASQQAIAPILLAERKILGQENLIRRLKSSTWRYEKTISLLIDADGGIYKTLDGMKNISTYEDFKSNIRNFAMGVEYLRNVESMFAREYKYVPWNNDSWALLMNGEVMCNNHDDKSYWEDRN